MAMLLCFDTVLWNIIGDAGLFVSSVVPSAPPPLSFHILTGNMGSRPRENGGEGNEVIPDGKPRGDQQQPGFHHRDGEEPAAAGTAGHCDPQASARYAASPEPG